MQKFPKLTKDQVALLRADQRKGYVLDELLMIAEEEGQEIYTVYESFDLAVSEANLIINENPNIECVIYGMNKKVLSFIKL